MGCVQRTQRARRERRRQQQQKIRVSMISALNDLFRITSATFEERGRAHSVRIRAPHFPEDTRLRKHCLIPFASCERSIPLSFPRVVGRDRERRCSVQSVPAQLSLTEQCTTLQCSCHLTSSQCLLCPVMSFRSYSFITSIRISIDSINTSSCLSSNARYLFPLPHGVALLSFRPLVQMPLKMSSLPFLSLHFSHICLTLSNNTYHKRMR